MAAVGLTKVVITPGAIPRLLKEPGVQADLMRRGRAIQTAAGSGHEVDLNIESVRASVIVYTATIDAMIAEATDRTLTRAIDAGRT